MDDEVRSLERKIREGDTDALAPYVWACVRAHRNMYEFLPLFVENRRNAALRLALRNSELLGMYYGNKVMCEFDGLTTPTGNLAAFNHLMYEYSHKNTPHYLAETARAVQTPNGLKFTFFKTGRHPGIKIDLTDGAVRDQPNPQILDFLFGNLRSSYMRQIETFTIAHNFMGSSTQNEISLDIAFSFTTIVADAYALRINTSRQRTRHENSVGVSPIAVELLSPPTDKN